MYFFRGYGSSPNQIHPWRAWETFWQNSFASERCYFRNILNSYFWQGFPGSLVKTSGVCLQTQVLVFSPSVTSQYLTFAKCPAVCTCWWKCQNASGELLQSQKSQKFQFSGFKGISKVRMADPKGSGAWASCQEVWISHTDTEGFPALSKAGLRIYYTART